MPIHEINFSWDRADQIRRILGRCIRSALNQHGDAIAGFALVSWDLAGETHSSYLAESGIIREGIMPAVVHDALNRHVTICIAEKQSPGKITGDK